MNNKRYKSRKTLASLPSRCLTSSRVSFSPSKKGKWDLIHSCRVINWDRHSHRTSDDEVTGPEVLAVPLGVSQNGEGGVGGGVYPSQLLQGLAVLLQSLSGSLETVREGQRGEGGGGGEFGLGKEKGEKC